MSEERATYGTADGGGPPLLRELADVLREVPNPPVRITREQAWRLAEAHAVAGMPMVASRCGQVADALRDVLGLP